MYKRFIGYLLYLTSSRPDVVSTMGIRARFQACPKESHLKAAQCLLRYMKETQDLVLYYSLGDSFERIGYSNRD